MNLPKNIIDEKTKISYTLHGDYYLPDLAPPDTDYPYPENPDTVKQALGKYALAKYRYLQNHRKPLLRMLQSQFKLNDYLRQVESECEEAYDEMEKRMMQAEGVTEALKASNQIEWIQRMNSIRSRLEEIIYAEYIYTD